MMIIGVAPLLVTALLARFYFLGFWKNLQDDAHTMGVFSYLTH